MLKNKGRCFRSSGDKVVLPDVREVHISFPSLPQLCMEISTNSRQLCGLGGDYGNTRLIFCW